MSTTSPASPAPGRVIVGMPSSRQPSRLRAGAGGAAPPAGRARRRGPRASKSWNLPQPKKTAAAAGRRGCCEASYVNFYLPNGAIDHAGLRRSPRRSGARGAGRLLPRPRHHADRRRSTSSKAAAASTASRSRNRRRDASITRRRHAIRLYLGPARQHRQGQGDGARGRVPRAPTSILLPEFFETPYFCQDQSPDHFALAQPFEGNTADRRIRRAGARAVAWCCRFSFFERAGHAHFNALAMIDADGTVVGRYRKSHIPDGPGYQEKYYFTPGRHRLSRLEDALRHARRRASAGTSGFRKSARAMALDGAEVLFYPTAIGSEPPPAPPVDSPRSLAPRDAGPRRGQLSCRSSAANRVGTEKGQAGEITFYGSSFIAGPTGEIVAELVARRKRAWSPWPFDSRRDRQDARLVGPVPRPPARSLWLTDHPCGQAIDGGMLKLGFLPRTTDRRCARS